MCRVWGATNCTTNQTIQTYIFLLLSWLVLTSSESAWHKKCYDHDCFSRGLQLLCTFSICWTATLCFNEKKVSDSSECPRCDYKSILQQRVGAASRTRRVFMQSKSPNQRKEWPTVFCKTYYLSVFCCDIKNNLAQISIIIDEFQFATTKV